MSTSNLCPVCGNSYCSNETVCPHCGWTFTSDYILGEITSEEERVQRQQVERVRQTWSMQQTRSILQTIEAMVTETFLDLCRAIVCGLGFCDATDVPLPGVGAAFQAVLVRQSTDEQFRTEEMWLIAFVRHDGSVPVVEQSEPDTSTPPQRRGWQIWRSRASHEPVLPEPEPSAPSTPPEPSAPPAPPAAAEPPLQVVLSQAFSLKVQNVLVAAFGDVQPDDIEGYHASAGAAAMRSMLFHDIFAAILASDYAAQVLGTDLRMAFSFARLREQIQSQSQSATWRQQFQSLTALPARLTPRRGEVAHDEADLSRAAQKTSSFLLLGDPGAGKTTSLQEFAEELARAGGRTPVFLPLNRYSGNLLADIGSALCEGIYPLSEDLTRTLLSSGALTVILDGFNEVQPQELCSALAKEIDQVTNLQSPTARSQWIVSSREYDYEHHLSSTIASLEAHAWKLQPLTADLIYHFLETGLGGSQEGKQAYDALGPSVREICSNPLLLNMVLTVRRETGRVPTGRGALYHQFVDLLLRWGAERVVTQQQRDALSELIGSPVSDEQHSILARTAMAKLAVYMTMTAIAYPQAKEAIKRTLTAAVDPDNAAAWLLDDLIQRGILRIQRQARVSFLHHTFQEYFQAFAMKDISPDKLIPKGGVEGPKREVVIFLAGIVDSPDPLVERALETDVNLAYQIVRDATARVSERLHRQVAEKIWWAIQSSTGFIGKARPFTLMFSDLAARLDRTVEQLASDIQQSASERTLLQELLEFYQEGGNASAQQEILERLGVKTAAVDEVPDDMLFRAAITAAGSGDRQRAIDLYTRYLEKYPRISAAYANRALSLAALGKYQEALADYERSLEINPDSANTLANYADLLARLDRKEGAILHLQRAIEIDPHLDRAHFHLGQLKEEAEPQEALALFAQAARLARAGHQSEYTQRYARFQERMGDLVGAVRSLKHLIELNPTSSSVREWKRKIADLRSAIDRAEQQRSAREKLLDQGEVTLIDLATEVLQAAKFQVETLSLHWLLATSNQPGWPKLLPVAMLQSPRLTSQLIREVIKSLPDQAQQVRSIVLLTTVQHPDQEAFLQMAAYRPERNIALITAIEAQDALLQGDQACEELLSEALRRSTIEQGNPFIHTKPVKQRSEFFGRAAELQGFTNLVQIGKPVALYGIHKIGKSSFLHQIHQRLSAYARDITPIWIEMHSAIKDASDLYRLILTRLRLDVPYQGIITSDLFRRMLTSFQQQKRQSRPGHRILLILDEYPYLIPDSSGRVRMHNYLEILEMFKALSQEERWFNILPCGRSPAISRVGEWKEGENPFIGIFKEQFLGPLTKADTEELVVTLGRMAGMSMTPPALDSIFALTGGHPLFARTLGGWILDRYPGEEVTEDMVELTANSYLEDRGQQAILLKIYQDGLDKEEQRMVGRLAQSAHPLLPRDLLPESPDDEDRRRLRICIDNLLATSVLVKDEEGRLSHRYELLRRAIAQELQEQELFGS